MDYRSPQVGRNDQIRYVAHLLCAWLFTCSSSLFPRTSRPSSTDTPNICPTVWIFYNIQYEMRLWLASRQLYLVSEEHSSLPQSRTVLVTGVPKSCVSPSSTYFLPYFTADAFGSARSR
jgi:hypothetical protein